jgi:DNA topoisomerase-1
LRDTGSAKEVPAELKANYGKVLGVDADHGFKPLYVILSGKEAVIKRLRKAQESAGELILATDEDR